MPLTDLINVITSTEMEFFGLTLYLAPDYFWNPRDGVFRALGFIQKTGIIDDTPNNNHLDDLSRFHLRFVGSCFLGLFLGHLLMNDEADKHRLFRLKIAMFTSILMLTSHTALSGPLDMLGETFLGLTAALSLVQIVWCLFELFMVVVAPPAAAAPTKTHRRAQDHLSGSTIWFLRSLLVYFSVIGTMIFVKPDIFGPNGWMPMVTQTTHEDNLLDELQDFTGRLLGAVTLGHTGRLLETLWNPTHTNVHACCQMVAIVSFLDAFVWFYLSRTIVDKEEGVGTADVDGGVVNVQQDYNSMYLAPAAFEFLVGCWALFFSYPKMKPKAKKASHQPHHGDRYGYDQALAPDLTHEGKKFV